MARNSGNKTNVQSVLHQLYGGDESTGRVPLPSVLHSFASYSNTIPAAGTDAEGTTPNTGANMGTFIGVYLPCIQNIFGVILFIRLTWIVGTAGAFCAFLVVLLCCSITMLTAISMSAIATNGVVPAGGAYYMISRSLGPEFGGAVGILFYIGTTLAGAMYIVGAIEILIIYMAPSITLFGDVDVPENMYNNYRVFGTALLLVLGLVVYFGVKLVNKFAAVALACVICSILAIYIGLFVNFNGNDQLPMCVLGNRLLQQVNGTCSKDASSALHKEFCPPGAMCDSYFETHNVSIVNGIQGLSSGVFLDNMWPSFMEMNHVLTKWDSSESDMVFPSATTNKQVITDITTSFAILVGIFFPSVTGIMAGSNRSGDLADAQKSIPAGTIGAIITTSVVYLSSIFLFAGTVDNLLLRDKFGQSIGGHLVLGHIAWPNEWVILIGAFLSTIGAGLQSLTGAPRLLQAIARDGVIPILEPFCASSSKGEPTRALLLTLVICECGVLLGNVDYLAPLLSMFFLMCYGFVNLACALQTLLKTPSWRPRFKYYHWSLSSLGMFLCLTVMFMTSWYYALIAMGIAGIIYKHIEYRGAEKEWGDGIVGLNLSAASFSLLHLEEAPPHTKNWRPQIMVLVKFPFENNSKQRKLFAFASQLKAGKGLTVATTVLEKDLVSGEVEALEAKQHLRKMMDEERVKGFVEVLCSPDIMIGMACLFQTTGLGRLKPNTVMIGWPSSWRHRADEKKFIGAMRSVAAGKMAVVVLKGIEAYPDSSERVTGTIDIWWIVHDGGLLMLLPFLLNQHRTWKNCKLRIFTVAQIEDNSIQMKKDLKKLLYALRIDAEMEVVEMTNSDISAYTYERTLIMEQRNLMLRQMGLVKLQGKSKFRGDTCVEMTSSPVNPNGVCNEEGVTLSPLQETVDISPSACYAEKRPIKRVSWDIGITPDKENVKKMHTAVKLNEVIVEKSKENAKLVIINLPSPPRSINPASEANYMEYLEVLTEGLERVLLVRGCGQEVIAM